MQRHEISYSDIRLSAPTQKAFVFTYKKIDNRSQELIYTQLSQYLTLKNKTEHLSKINSGICFGLSEYYKKNWQHYSTLLAEVEQWNGALETITPKLSQFFDDIYKESIDYLVNNNQRNLYLVVDNLPDLLLTKQSFTIMNGKHASAVVYDNDQPKYKWQVFDPNYADGKAKLCSLQQAIYEIHHRLGQNISVLDLPMHSKINDIPLFIESGGLLSICLAINADNYIKSIINNEQPLERQHFSGLFYRSGNHLPAWYCAANNYYTYRVLIANLLFKLCLLTNFKELVSTTKSSLQPAKKSSVHSFIDQELSALYHQKIKLSHNKLKFYIKLLISLSQRFHYISKTRPLTPSAKEAIGFDWPLLKRQITFTSKPIDTPYVLNPTLLTNFLDQPITADDSDLLIRDGIIAQNRNRHIHVNLTRDMSQAEWAELLSYCVEQQVTLTVHGHSTLVTTPLLNRITNMGIKLFSSPVVNSYPTLLPNRHIKLLQTNDVEALLTNYEEGRIIVDVTQLDMFDILKMLQLPVPDDITYDFIASLNQLFTKEKLIIFVGKFSNELLDMFAPWLIASETSLALTNKIIFLFDATTNLNFVNVQTIRVTSNDKATIIAREFSQPTYETLRKNYSDTEWENTQLTELRKQATTLSLDPLEIASLSLSPPAASRSPSAAAEQYEQHVTTLSFGRLL